jgi:VanZ family protein
MTRFWLFAAFGRIGTWVGIGVIAWLSLLPAGQEFEIDLPEPAQHFGAYLILGVALVVAYPKHWLWGALGVVSLGAGLEFLQQFSSGRDPSRLDAAFSTAGAIVGIAAATTYLTLRRRRGVGSSTWR